MSSHFKDDTYTLFLEAFTKGNVSLAQFCKALECPLFLTWLKFRLRERS